VGGRKKGQTSVERLRRNWAGRESDRSPINPKDDSAVAYQRVRLRKDRIPGVIDGGLEDYIVKSTLKRSRKSTIRSSGRFREPLYVMYR